MKAFARRGQSKPEWLPRRRWRVDSALRRQRLRRAWQSGRRKSPCETNCTRNSSRPEGERTNRANAKSGGSRKTAPRRLLDAVCDGNCGNAAGGGESNPAGHAPDPNH